MLAAARDQFRNDGVVKLPGVLSPALLAQAKACYDWSLANLGPNGRGGDFLEAGPETWEDKANPKAPAVYEDFLRAGPFARMSAKLWDGQESCQTWFMYEQVFRKVGCCRRTPWHQDSSYLAVDGDNLIVFWISFAAVPEAEALEFVRGSHRGPLYDGSTFNIDDPTEPLYGGGELPRLPDVDAEPGEWDIVAWATEPGDVIAFHPKVLHGGAATSGATRDTLSLRFFGSDAVYASRPGPCGPRVAGLHESLDDGDAFRHPAFLKIT